MWTAPRRGSRTRRGNRPGYRAAILGVFKPVCLERQALRFTSLSDARLYGRVKSSLVCGERAVLLSSPCIVESDSSSPQISNARLIMPRDLSIDQQALHLAEMGESPLKILLYSWGLSAGYQPRPQVVDRGTTARYGGQLRYI